MSPLKLFDDELDLLQRRQRTDSGRFAERKNQSKTHLVLTIKDIKMKLNSNLQWSKTTEWDQMMPNRLVFRLPRAASLQIFELT